MHLPPASFSTPNVAQVVEEGGMRYSVRAARPDRFSFTTPTRLRSARYAANFTSACDALRASHSAPRRKWVVGAAR
jgi:hypothetical protein